MTRRSACQSPPAAPVKSLGAAARGAPGRDRAAPLRPRGGPCSAGLIHPAFLTQQPAAAVRSMLRTGPLCLVFSTLAPRCVRALAERGPTGSSRAQRVQDSWLKPCPRSCRALCAWRRLFHGAVGETRSTFPAHGTAMPADLGTGTGARAVRLGGGGGLREEGSSAVLCGGRSLRQ